MSKPDADLTESKNNIFIKKPYRTLGSDFCLFELVYRIGIKNLERSEIR